MSELKFCNWEKTVPLAIKEDSLWKMKVYRLALFLSDISWYETSKLYKDGRTKVYQINYPERLVQSVQILQKDIQ